MKNIHLILFTVYEYRQQKTEGNQSIRKKAYEVPDSKHYSGHQQYLIVLTNQYSNQMLHADYHILNNKIL